VAQVKAHPLYPRCEELYEKARELAAGAPAEIPAKRSAAAS
jgi:hypothetical protein